MLALVLALATLVSPHAQIRGVEQSFADMWTAAQRERPAAINSLTQVTGQDEPGTPLRVRMRVFQADGQMSLAGALVFIHQTDSSGVYDRPGGNGWRLKAWARTGADGRVTFDTVRPGPYPGRDVAAHIHVGIDGPPGQRRLLPDLLFADDPLLSAAERDKSARAGAFANIRPLRIVGGRAEVEILYRLPGDYIF